MSVSDESILSQIISKFGPELLQEWLSSLLTYAMKRDASTEREIERQCEVFLHGLQAATANGQSQGIESRQWEDVRQLLMEISQLRARQGFSPIDTANFVFSL